MESLISFPMVLEPATKSRVLTLDSTEEMRRQFYNEVSQRQPARRLATFHVPVHDRTRVTV